MPSTVWTSISQVEKWDQQGSTATWALDTDNWDQKSTEWSISLEATWETMFQHWNQTTSNWG